MKKITKTIKLSILIVFMFTFYNNQAQEQIAVIQSPNILLLDAMTGDIVDPSFIDLTPLDHGTPKAILQVGDELWITDQIRDRIDRFDLEGNHLGQIGGIIPDGGLDNIKGMAVVNNSEVWVTNAGSNNGAPGNAIVRFDFEGNNLGFFLVAPQSTTSFDIVDNGNGEVYISYITSNNIERRDYDGNFIANIVGPGVVSFIQQIQITQNNDILAAVFSNTGSSGNNQGIYRFDVNDGSILDYYSHSNLRGVRELGNGNILYTNSGGIHRINVATGVSTMLSSGGAQFFGAVLLEECSSSPDAPTGLAAQTHCDGNTVADLEATGQNIKWYSTATGGSPLPSSDPLVSDTYYATQTVDGCESEDRFEVSVTLISPETPIGDSTQSFSGTGATLADLVVSPENVSWFASEEDALAGNNPLPLSTVLIDGETYYAVNIVDGCLSEPLAVTVFMNLGTSDFDNSNFTFYPNPTDGIVQLIYNKSITGVIVSNLLGQVVLNKEFNSNKVEIDLSTLPNAVYILQVHSENGSKVIKVIKK
jgi:hypothetical protein